MAKPSPPRALTVGPLADVAGDLAVFSALGVRGVIATNAAEVATIPRVEAALVRDRDIASALHPAVRVVVGEGREAAARTALIARRLPQAEIDLELARYMGGRNPHAMSPWYGHQGLDVRPTAVHHDEDDARWMTRALELAAEAAALGEVPVGAVLVHEDREVAAASNRREVDLDPLGHAELMVIRDGARALSRWRLADTTLYVTLEPCTMCAGAIVQSRVSRVVFGADDPKAGAVVSLARVLSDGRAAHRPIVEGGVLAAPCSAILREFFARRR